MSESPVRVASIGMGWWSDVLADAVQRTRKLKIAACFTRSAGKREAFAKKYGCRAASSYEEILRDPEIEAVLNTTPNHVHLETARAAAEAGKHTFLDKPIAHTIADGGTITRACKEAGAVLSVGRVSGGARAISGGSGARLMKGSSGGWCRRRATSAGTGRGCSSPATGATRPTPCRAG